MVHTTVEVVTTNVHSPNGLTPPSRKGAGPAAQATTVTFNKFVEDDGNPGLNSAHDTLAAPWSESVALSQFSSSTEQLDAVKVSYSLFLQINESVKSYINASESFSFQNTLAGSLALNGTTLISLADASQSVSTSVLNKGSFTFPTFTYLVSGSVTLAGADVLPFIGAGTVSLTSIANATIVKSLPIANFDTHILAEGNANITLDYFTSPIPTPASTPEGGNSLPLLSFSCAGLFVAGAARRTAAKV